MDLWDLTKVLFRRWYIALPVLMASLAVVLYMSATVKPDYVAKGYLQLIPPASAAQTPDPKDPNATTRPENVWIQLGLDNLVNAAILKVVDPPVLGKLVEAGYAGSVVVNQPTKLPLLYIEAVGSTPQQATQTVQAIIKELDKDILALQVERNVYPEDTITTLKLMDGTNPEVKTSKVKRVVAVAGVIGLLFTIVGTILVDTVLRRRGRKQSAVGEADPDLRAQVPAKTQPQPSGMWNTALPEQRYGVQAAVVPTSPPAGPSMPVVQRPTVRVPEVERDDGGPIQEPDATIVLPLSLSTRDRADRRS